MAPESTEQEKGLEQAPVQDKDVELEVKYSNALTEFRDKLSFKLNNYEVREGQVFNILFNSPEQRSVLEEVYGAQEINQLERDLNSLPIDDKNALIDLILGRVAPVIRRLFFEPEVAARRQQIEDRINPPREEFKAGQIDGYIISSPWEFTIGAGTGGEVKVVVADSIMELNWPENSRWGLQAVKESLKEVAKLLSERLEIKAVVGVSWMMAHNGASEIGFERFPDLPVHQDVREGSVMMAVAGRKDKPYKSGQQPKLADVIVGAMSRAEFLRRFL